MKWPAVDRVWLPEWLQNRNATVARLPQAVQDAKERKAEPEPVAVEAEVEPVVSVVESAAVTEQREFAPLRSAPAAPVTAPAPRRHPMLQTFREWVPQAVGDLGVLDELAMQYAKQKVRTVIDGVIAAEGPIHPDRPVKLVAGAFGLNRVAESRRKAIRQLVPVDYYRRSDPEGFYWPAGIDPETWRVVRCPVDGAGRVLDEVSLIEIGNAMLVVAEQTGGIEAEELKREALGLFGGKRMTAGIEAQLAEALERAVGSGLLILSGARLIRRAEPVA